MQIKKENSHPIEMPGINLRAMQVKTIELMIKDAQKRPAYRYPWDMLEEDLKRKKLSKIPVVGYGSLVNIRSAALTLSEESLKNCRPVITFGVRRLFNYKMPSNSRYYTSPMDTVDRAALNVNLTGCVYDVVNGVLIEVLSKDIPSIRKREIGYDLVPVVSIPWEKTDITPFLAYIFYCPEEPREGKHLTSDKILPHREYYLVCRKGAKELGEEFLRLWLLTTYLADGVTTVTQWEVTEFQETDSGL